MSDDVVIALIAAASAALGAGVVRALDWWAARKMGLGALQRDLIATLQQTNLAYRDRVLVLDAQAATEASEHARLTGRVEALEQLLRDALTAAPAVPPARRRRAPSQEEA